MQKSKQCYYVSTLNGRKQPHNSIYRKFSEKFKNKLQSERISVQNSYENIKKTPGLDIQASSCFNFVVNQKPKQCYYDSTLNRRKQPKNSVYRKFSEKFKNKLQSERVSVQNILYTAYFISFAGKNAITASNETIAEYFDYCTKTVSRAVKRLIELKLLKVESTIKYSHVDHKPITLRTMYLTKKAKKLFRIREYFYDFCKMSHKNLSIRITNVIHKTKTSISNKITKVISKTNSSINNKYIENSEHTSKYMCFKDCLQLKEDNILKKKLGYRTYNELIEGNCCGSKELGDALKQYLKVLCRKGKYILNKDLYDMIEYLKSLVSGAIEPVKEMIKIVERSIANHWTKFYPPSSASSDDFSLRSLHPAISRSERSEKSTKLRGDWPFDLKFKAEDFKMPIECDPALIKDCINKAKARLAGETAENIAKTESLRSKLLQSLTASLGSNEPRNERSEIDAEGRETTSVDVSDLRSSSLTSGSRNESEGRDFTGRCERSEKTPDGVRSQRSCSKFNKFNKNKFKFNKNKLKKLKLLSGKLREEFKQEDQKKQEDKKDSKPKKTRFTSIEVNGKSKFMRIKHLKFKSKKIIDFKDKKILFSKCSNKRTECDIRTKPDPSNVIDDLDRDLEARKASLMKFIESL